MQVFRSLVGQRAQGTFFLRGLLQDHTTEEHFARIMGRVNKVLEEQGDRVCSPMFEIREHTNTALELAVTSMRNASLDHLGSIYLVADQPQGQAYPVLALEGTTWESVPKRRYRPVGIRVIMDRIRDMEPAISASRYLLLMSHMAMLERLTVGVKKDFRFTLEVTETAISVEALEQGKLLTSITVAV